MGSMAGRNGVMKHGAAESGRTCLRQQSTVPVRWGQALSMQCDAPRGRERGQIKAAAEQRGRFRCDRMRCDAMRSVVYIGSAPAWAGTRHRGKYLARQLGPGAGSRSSQWRMRYWAGVLEAAGGARSKNKRGPSNDRVRNAGCAQAWRAAATLCACCAGREPEGSN